MWTRILVLMIIKNSRRGKTVNLKRNRTWLAAALGKDIKFRRWALMWISFNIISSITFSASSLPFFSFMSGWQLAHRLHHLLRQFSRLHFYLFEHVCRQRQFKSREETDRPTRAEACEDADNNNPKAAYKYDFHVSRFRRSSSTAARELLLRSLPYATCNHQYYCYYQITKRTTRTPFVCSLL